MLSLSNKFLTALLVFASVFGSIGASAAEFGWQIVKVEDRDYLTVGNIAQFYQLRGNLVAPDGRVSLTDGRNRLDFIGARREMYVNGVKQWLSYPIVVREGQLLVSRFDLAKTIEPCLRPTMIANLHPFQTVVIDAGHGGADRGASSATGFEKDYTLDVIRDLKKSLEEKGLKVLMTRDDDTYLPLESRAQRLNENENAIFVSVHFNSSNDGGLANGFEVFAMTPVGAASTADSGFNLEQIKNEPGNAFDNASLALANCVHYSLLGHIPQVDRGVKRARFAVLRLSNAPAVLVEGGFLTNGPESQRINDPVWRKKLAVSIAEGIASYQTLSTRKTPPKLLADYRGEQLPLGGVMIDPATIAMSPVRKSAVQQIVPVSNPAPAPVAAPRKR